MWLFLRFSWASSLLPRCPPTPASPDPCSQTGDTYNKELNDFVTGASFSSEPASSEKGRPFDAFSAMHTRRCSEGVIGGALYVTDRVHQSCEFR